MKKRTKKEQRIVTVLKAIKAAEMLTYGAEPELEQDYLELIKELEELLVYLAAKLNNESRAAMLEAMFRADGDKRNNKKS